MVPAPIQFDRASGVREGANRWERTAALTLATGSKMSHQGFHPRRLQPLRHRERIPAKPDRCAKRGCRASHAMKV